MLRLLTFILDLFILLPWWGAVAVLLSLGVGLWAAGHYIVYRLKREFAGAIREQGTPLAEAQVTVHSVKATEPAKSKSALDDFDDEFGEEDSDDEEAAELDGEFAEDDSAWYWVEATIAPKSADVDWNPGDLTLVPIDFHAQEEFEFCRQTALLHTLEVWRDGRFESQGNDSVTGPQRLRMLFAIPQEVREAKFTYHFTEFGKVALPPALVLARR